MAMSSRMRHFSTSLPPTTTVLPARCGKDSTWHLPAPRLLLQLTPLPTPTPPQMRPRLLRPRLAFPGLPLPWPSMALWANPSVAVLVVVTTAGTLSPTQSITPLRLMSRSLRSL